MKKVNHRKDLWLNTFSGRCVPFTATPEVMVDHIDIEDIAYALSRVCRFNGHISRFYSVAEHCIIMADYVYKQTGDKAKAFQTLMHDASEAYVCDVPSPIKAMLPEYKALEANVMAAVWLRYDMPAGKPAWLNAIDKRIYLSERNAMIRARAKSSMEPEMDPLPIRFYNIRGRFPSIMRAMFMNRFNKYRR